jgi:hypothetical protein
VGHEHTVKIRSQREDKRIAHTFCDRFLRRQEIGAGFAP